MKSSKCFFRHQHRITRKLQTFTLVIILTFLVLIIPQSVHATREKSKEGNSVGNMLNGGNSCIYGNYIYYSVCGTIYRVNVKTLKKETVAISESAAFFSSINVSNGWVYCTMYTSPIATVAEDCYIYKIRTNGKDGQILAEGHSATAVNGWIYYINQKNVSDPYNIITNGIYKMNVNGYENTCIKKSREVYECVLDDNKLYYSTGIFDPNWYQMTLKGKSVEKIGKKGMNFHDIDKGYLYYSIYDEKAKTNGLYKQKVGGEKSTKILSCSTIIGSANIENGWIYYQASNKDYSKDIMYKIKTNGSNKKKLTSKSDIINISINGNCIYYIAGSEANNKGIYKYTACLMTNNGKKNSVLKQYYSQ